MRLLSLIVLFAVLDRADAISLRFLAWNHELAAKKLLVRSGDQDQEITGLHPDKRSGKIESAAAAGLALVVAGDAGSRNVPTSIPLAIPSAFTNPLILLIPAPGKPGGITPFVIEDSPQSFRMGSTRFISASPTPLVVRYEKNLVRLEKPWTPFDVMPGGAARNIGVQIESADKPGTILYSAVWEYDLQVRKLAIVLPGSDREDSSMSLKIIAERVQSPEGP